jgi:hypothetical protein
MVDILHGWFPTLHVFHLIQKFNMASTTNSFWCWSFKILSETTRGMNMLFGRNMSYLTIYPHDHLGFSIFREKRKFLRDHSAITHVQFRLSQISSFWDELLFLFVLQWWPSRPFPPPFHGNNTIHYFPNNGLQILKQKLAIAII